MQVSEETPLRVGLHAEDVSVAVAQSRDVVCRPARVPRIASVLPAVVHEAEHNLVVVDELLQHSLFAMLWEEEFALRMGRDEGDHAPCLQAAREHAGAPVFQLQQARSALVVARVVRREDGLGRVRHHASEGGQQPRLHEHLESVAHAENGFAGVHESDEVLRELRPEARREDRARADVVARSKPSGNHQDVVVVQVSSKLRGRVARELLQVDLLRLRSQMAEKRDGLLLAIRPLDVDDADANRGALQETTTCFGIVLLQASRITGMARDVHCGPSPRCRDRRPVVPR